MISPRSKACVLATACLGLALLGLPALAAAQVWTHIEQDATGLVRYAEGLDEAGTPLRLAYGLEEGAVTVLFQRGRETLTVRSEGGDGWLRLRYAAGAQALGMAMEGGEHGPVSIALDMPGGETRRFRLDKARSAVPGAMEAASALAGETAFLSLARDYLTASRSLPAPHPMTADPVLEPVLLSTPEGGSWPDMTEWKPSEASLRCYQECVNDCPGQCDYLCWGSRAELLCQTCLVSCSLGCGIGCGCFSCNVPAPAFDWDDGGRF